MSELIPAVLDFAKKAFADEPDVDIADDDDSADPCPECPHTIGDHEPQDEEETILVCTICGCTIEADDDDEDDDEDFDDDDDEDFDDEDDEE